MKVKQIIKKIVFLTPLKPISAGSYIRGLYLKKCVSRLPLLTFKNILDAGCGEGEFSKWFAKNYPFLNVNGYDREKSFEWKSKYKNLSFRKFDLLKLDEENKYDLCYCIDVLEHIPKNKKVISLLHKALKSGGYLLIHMPNKAQKRILPEKLFLKNKEWARKEHIGEMYSENEIKELIRRVGFKDVEIIRTFGFYGKIAWEIDKIIEKNILLRILFAPFLKLLSQIESLTKIEDGNGILVLVKKSF